MVEGPLNPNAPIVPGTTGPAQEPVKSTQSTTGTETKSFKETMTEFMDDVNKLQLNAGESVEKLLTGEIKDAHDVMVAVEKANTSFELMMEIRNKMLDAYREIMRMQV